MKIWAAIAGIFAFFLVLLVNFHHLQVQAQTIELAQSNPEPNRVLSVSRQSGKCPKAVGMWVTSFGYLMEGVAVSEEVVIADTLAIAAGAAELAEERFRFIRYQAPLKPAYASCVGQASTPNQPDSLEAQYKFQFQQGKVYFSIDVTGAPEGFGAGITEHKVIGLRPFAVVGFVD